MEKGAYIFYDEHDNIDLFIFMKCTTEELHKALPISYSMGEILENHDTLYAIFHKGTDYLGSESFEEIPQLIEKISAVDLISNSFEILKNKHFPTLMQTQYNNLLNFSKTQLNY